MATTAERVRELRDKTGAGVMDCKEALAACQDDLDKAVDWLRKKGVASAAKRAGREAREGVIGTYVHHTGKLGVMIEINCESDFVARTDAVQELARNLAMQVASASPTYVSREDVPADVLEREKEIYRSQLAEQKKPPAVLEKIIEGKLGKFFEEACLVEQVYQRDPSGKTKVLDLLNEVSAKTGEKVAVRRFARYQVGGG
jgi:elongation factor Ts